MNRLSKKEKIFFVTSPDLPFFPGRGGTEAFTFSHIRELRRRGFDARLVTVDKKRQDGRRQVPDIPFLDVESENDLCDLDATLISVCKPFVVPTKRPAYIMVHVPPSSTAYPSSRFKKALSKHSLIANSQFTKKAWAESLRIDPASIAVVYPFADPAFSRVTRPSATGTTRVLFAGRLHISKGIYLLLEALHHPVLQQGYQFSVIDVQEQTKDSQILVNILKQHPRIELLPAQTSPEGVAKIMANHNIVVVPSNHYFWQEAFGMVSVEAQHAGCRVVASNAGGLPETDLGALHLFEPGNSLALATTIELAKKAGPVSSAARKRTSQQLTVGQSVDSLLKIIRED